MSVIVNKYFLVLFCMIFLLRPAYGVKGNNVSFYGLSELKAPQSCDHVASWAWQAIEGDAIASFNMGVLYYKGVCVSEDHKNSRSLFSRSAQLGYLEGYYVLALMFEYGVGGDRDGAMADKMIAELLNLNYKNAILHICYKLYIEGDDDAPQYISRYNIDCLEVRKEIFSKYDLGEEK